MLPVPLLPFPFDRLSRPIPAIVRSRQGQKGDPLLASASSESTWTCVERPVRGRCPGRVRIPPLSTDGSSPRPLLADATRLVITTPACHRNMLRARQRASTRTYAVALGTYRLRLVLNSAAAPLRLQRPRPTSPATSRVATATALSTVGQGG